MFVRQTAKDDIDCRPPDCTGNSQCANVCFEICLLLKVVTNLPVICSRLNTQDVSFQRARGPRKHHSVPAAWDGMFIAKRKVMDLLDISVIYLALGAPFGVRFYLVSETGGPVVLLRSVIVAAVWILYIPGFLHNLVTAGLRVPVRSGRTIPGKEIHTRVKPVSRKIEAISAGVSDAPGIFTVREVIERHAGIAALAESASRDVLSGVELFRIAGHPDPELGALCTQRHNGSTLNRHRTEAARDLVRLFEILAGRCQDPKELAFLFSQLFDLAGNSAAASDIRKKGRAAEVKQERRQKEKREREIWNSAKPKAQSMMEYPMAFEKISVTSKLPSKD